MASMMGVGRQSPERISRWMSNPHVTGRMTPERLDRVIESEVIPRLLVAHSEPVMPARETADIITPEEIMSFSDLVLTARADEVLEAVEGWLARGVPLETIFVELFAPTARRMGEGWEEDSLDFIEVTMALWRLQEVLREVALRSPRSLSPPDFARSGLFMSMPGDQHSFGTAMLEECFARAGWDTLLLIDETRRELLANVSSRRFDLVALTVTLEAHIERLPSMISALRSVSRNPDIKIMIGGCMPLAHHGLSILVGADGTAATAIEAVATAEMLVDVSACNTAA